MSLYLRSCPFSRGYDVQGSHDEPSVVVVIVHRLPIELDHSMDEPLHVMRSRDDAISFVEGGELAINFVSTGAWSMFLVEVSLVTSS